MNCIRENEISLAPANETIKVGNKTNGKNIM